VREGAAHEGWFDLSTLREPYRLEGKKTIGYELAESLSWTLPDVVVCPTGGGTGLVGLWKAFEELAQLRLLRSDDRPRMVAVQAAGCAPIVRAYTTGREHAERWEDPATYAAGLRVPSAIGDRLILRALRESGGTALAVTDEQMGAGQLELARGEGIFAGPESGAGVAAVRVLADQGWIRPADRVVLLSTGTGLKTPRVPGLRPV
jgi:threonine synthase